MVVLCVVSWDGVIRRDCRRKGWLTGIPCPQFLTIRPSRRTPAIQLWLSRLSAISDVMDQWLLVQNMWMYMEAVFR